MSEFLMVPRELLESLSTMELDTTQRSIRLQDELRALLSAQSAPEGEREAFDKWFRAEQLIADHIDTTFISEAFLPYKAFKAGAAWNRRAQPAEADGVEVVAFIQTGNGMKPVARIGTPADLYFPGGDASGYTFEPLMTVAQHQRILSAVTAERDVFLRQVDTLTEWYSNSLDVIRDITAALPGTQYMDPPDGGDVSVPEQVRRMAKDADRYRWLRGRLPGSAYRIAGVIYSQGGDGVDAAVDAAMAAKEGV